VSCEKNSKIAYHAYDGSGDAGERCGKFQVAMRCFNERAAQQDKYESRKEGKAMCLTKASGFMVL